MRTTVTLDADVEQIIRRRMREKGVSFKQALNDSVREGAAGARSPRSFTSPVFNMGTPSVPLTKALHLAAQLEDEGIIGKMERGV